jgi:hypothetical protein
VPKVYLGALSLFFGKKAEGLFDCAVPWSFESNVQFKDLRLRFELGDFGIITPN